MKKCAWILLGALALSQGGRAYAKEEPLRLRVATQAHPHALALLDGSVQAQGCVLEYSTHSVTELREDLAKNKAFDVLEVEILPYIEAQSRGELQEYLLIPVFLSRQFQLRNVYIRTDRGITTPADLRGKTIGVTGYNRAMPTWVRGIFQSSWSVKPEEITWKDTLTSTGTTSSLEQWLTSGKVDAILTFEKPEGLGSPDAKFARLFPDFRTTEYDTFHVTRVFPIITTLAIKKDLATKNPWVSESLFLAFCEAKKKAMSNLTLPLPWGGAKLEETEHMMGKNFWSYGTKSNPKTLGALFRYAHEQHLLAKKVTIEDVFDPSTLLLIEP